MAGKESFLPSEAPKNRMMDGFSDDIFIASSAQSGFSEDDEPIDNHADFEADVLAGEVSDEEAEKAAKTGNTTENEEGLDSIMGIYVRDIGRIPLLTGEEEVVLAKTREDGELAKRELLARGIPIPRLKTPSEEFDEELLGKAPNQAAPVDEETQKLLDRVLAGEDASKRLTEANLRLVISVARRYLGRGLPFPDLIQEGSIGLRRSVEKFDYRRGYKFSTYAYWWIRQGVTRAIADQSRTIRVPVHMIEQIGGLYSKLRYLQQKLGRDPTPEEWANESDISVDRLQKSLKAIKNPISLDTPVGEEQDTTIADYIADRNVDLERAADELLVSLAVENALKELNPRERTVLRMRFGLEDGRDRTLGEIGKELGVSRERIRQLEAEAIQKLRRPLIRNRLRGFLEE